MNQFIALLRGINVGGKNKIDMAQLKNVFEELGFRDVQTYINSGNILFSSTSEPHPEAISGAIKKTFSLDIPVLLRSARNIQKLAKQIPADWVNDASTKTDVMFLWDDVDSPKVLKQLSPKDFDNVMYVSGAVVWSVDKSKASRSGLMKLVGTKLYKRMTIRNVNTVRKLAELTTN